MEMIMQHKFVDFIPEQLSPNTLYISLQFNTASHLCFCGCGHEVVTPLSPTDWELKYNGNHVSLSPSIGNWGFSCQSHYFIRSGQIQWCGSWSQEKIDAGRKSDKANKLAYFKDYEQETKDSLKTSQYLISGLKRKFKKLLTKIRHYS